MKHLLLALFLLGAVMNLCAQEVSEYLVVSEDDKTPVKNAYVYNKATSEGSIVDDDGLFALDKDIRDNDTIVASCLGYEQTIICGSQLKRVKKIRMVSVTYALEEVIARPNKAVDIVNKVKELLNLNYPNELCRYKLHVEHLLSSGSKKVTRFSGAVVCSLDGYQKNESGEYRLLTYNEFEDHKNELGFSIPYRFDVFPDQLVERAILKNLNFLEKTKRYNYTIEESAPNTIRISFKPLKMTGEYRFSGYMIINPATYAIEYLVYNEEPGMFTKKDMVLYVSYIPVPLLKTNGVYTCKKGSTTISFVKNGGKYHIGRMVNEYTYLYKPTKGDPTEFSAVNEIENMFGVIADYEKLKQINMNLYNLEEWDYNELKLSANERRQKAKYEKYIKKIKEKYPDIEL